MRRVTLLWLSLSILAALGFQTQDLSLLRKVKFQGKLTDDKEISGIGRVGDFLLLVADEPAEVGVLRAEGDGYRVAEPIPLPNPHQGELDLEAVAVADGWVYVLGSHSTKRQKLKAKDSAEINRRQIERRFPEPARDCLIRFRLTPDGKASEIQSSSLAGVLDQHPILAQFREIPGKENGVDLEGLAVKGGWLYVGSRGPVLRGNWVPVLKCRFQPGKITAAETLYLDLGGLGIRELTAVEGGFLVIAGPMGEGPGGFHLYFWDGNDCLLGTRSGPTVGQCRRLAEIPQPEGGKPEGLLLLEETPAHYEFMIVHDGLKMGGPLVYQLGK